MLGISMNPTAGRIAAFWQGNEAFLANAAQRIASGKQVIHPSDGAGEYFRGDSIRRENNVYEMFQRDLHVAQQVLSVADKTGTFVYDDLMKMKDLVTGYQDPNSTASMKSAIQIQFDATANKVNQFITLGATYDGRRLVDDTTAAGPLASVNLDPNDITQKLDVSFDAGDVADTTGLDITSAGINAALDAVIGKATSYMSKVAGYKVGLNAQSSMIDNKLTWSGNFESVVEKSDEPSMMMKFTDYSTRQQMTASMFGQMMSLQRSVVNLLG